MARRLEHIVTAFSVPFAKARIIAKDTFSLAEKYKAYEASQTDREAIAEDMRRIAEYYNATAALILDPSYATATEDGLNSLLEGDSK